MTGADGNVRYGLPDGSTTVTLEFTIPWVGSNEYNAVVGGAAAGQYTISFDEGQGQDNTTVTVYFSNAA